MFDGSICWFALCPNWDAVLFAGLWSIVEAHLIEVIGMEGIQIHLSLLLLLKLISPNYTTIPANFPQALISAQYF